MRMRVVVRIVAALTAISVVTVAIVYGMNAMNAAIGIVGLVLSYAAFEYALHEQASPPRTRTRTASDPVTHPRPKGHLVRAPRPRILAAGLVVLSGGAAVAAFMHTPDLAKAVLTGHTREVSAVAFSPDGGTIATGSLDGTSRLWNAASGKQIGAPLTGHSAGVTDVAFSPNGKTLATASDDDTIRLWNLNTHRQSGRPLAEQAANVAGIAFSPNGKTLVSTEGFAGPESDARVLARVWDVNNRRQIARIGSDPNDIRTVEDLASSPDGHTTALYGTLLWDVKHHQDSTLDNASLGIAAFNPNDDSSFATADGTCFVEDPGPDPERGPWLRRTDDGEPFGDPFVGHEDGVTSLAFSPHGRILASGSCDHTARLWDVPSRRQVGPPLTGHADTVTSVAISPDGRVLGTGSVDGTARLWDVANHG